MSTVGIPMDPGWDRVLASPCHKKSSKRALWIGCYRSRTQQCLLRSGICPEMGHGKRAQFRWGFAKWSVLVNFGTTWLDCWTVMMQISQMFRKISYMHRYSAPMCTSWELSNQVMGSSLWRWLSKDSEEHAITQLLDFGQYCGSLFWILKSFKLLYFLMRPWRWHAMTPSVHAAIGFSCRSGLGHENVCLVIFPVGVLNKLKYLGFDWIDMTWWTVFTLILYIHVKHINKDKPLFHINTGPIRTGDHTHKYLRT